MRPQGPQDVENEIPYGHSTDWTKPRREGNPPIDVSTGYVGNGTLVARKMAKKGLIESLGKPLQMPRAGAIHEVPAVAPTCSIHPSNAFSAISHCMRCRSFRSRIFFSRAGSRSNVIFAG